MYPTKIEQDYILRNLLSVGEKIPISVQEMSYKQLSLFDDVNFRKEQFEIPVRNTGGKAPIERYLG